MVHFFVKNLVLPQSESYFSYFKDAVLIVATIIGTCVAISGLSTWKKQLSGNLKHDIAYKLLKATYILRDATQRVRNPRIFLKEQVDAGSDMSDLKDADKNYKNYVKLYDKRWQKIIEASNELQLNLLDAEITFGSEIKNKFIVVTDKVNDLYSAINSNLDSLNPNYHGDRKISLEKYFMINAIPNQDKYREEFDQIVGKIENTLKPYLLR